VFIPGATFARGGAMVEAELAKSLCAKEPLAVLCNGDANHFDIMRSTGRAMPAHLVTQSAFYLDRTEVTVENYSRCVAAGKCSAPAFATLDPRYDRPDFPASHIGWDDAKDYCKFAGGRLPTESEWELAARGAEGRPFPWGKIYNPHLCNHGSFAGDATDASDGFGGLAPVGSFKDGATPLGLLDMAGNVAEWVEDRFELVLETVLGYSPQPQINPVVTQGNRHIARGGSFDDPAFSMLTTWRTFLLGEVQRASVGVRCAYDLGVR